MFLKFFFSRKLSYYILIFYDFKRVLECFEEDDGSFIFDQCFFYFFVFGSYFEDIW